jgi:hypothetical protein
LKVHRFDSVFSRTLSIPRPSYACPRHYRIWGGGLSRDIVSGLCTYHSFS